MFTFCIEVYTPGLLISGYYDLSLYRRVSDALNSRIHRYTNLRDATIAPQGRPHQVQRVPQLLVDWGGALLVATLEEPEPPADYQAASGAVRDLQPTMFFTEAFALRANFYKRPGLDMLASLEQSTDDFVALSDVQIFPLNGGQPVTRKFACLNRAHIQALYAIGAAAPPVTPAPPPLTVPPLSEEPPADAAALEPDGSE